MRLPSGGGLKKEPPAGKGQQRRCLRCPDSNLLTVTAARTNPCAESSSARLRIYSTRPDEQGAASVWIRVCACARLAVAF